MANKGIDVVMGGAGLFREKPATIVPQVLETLSKHQVKKIDTAVIYGDSEEVIGLYNAGSNFTIDTKIPGGFRPNTSSTEQVITTGHRSLQTLRVPQVDILYVHSPDTSVPFEHTLAGLDALHREGMFRRLGLSNFKPAQVTQVHDICAAKGYVKPSVYQGNYNAFARSYEAELLPLLRRYGMSFYAYSPQAGGFLSKTSELVRSGKGEGRFLGEGAVADLYKAMYKKKSLMEGLTLWNEIAETAGIKPGDMAVRWVRFNSALRGESGDALIIGGRTFEQVDQTLETLDQGPLSDDVCRRIDEVWDMVKGEAPVDNYHDFARATLKK